MKFWLFILLALTLFATAAAQKKGKDAKPPEIELKAASARREDGKVLVDARLRNQGDRPIRNLVLIVDFLSSDRQVLTTQKGEIEEENLEPGAEASFSAQMNEPARVTSFRISFEDGAGRYYRSTRSGPFPIE